MNSIYDFQDYRQYLISFVASLRRSDPSLSDRKLAKKLGFPSHNHIGQVLHRSKNIGDKTIDRLAKALGFNKQEAHYFRNLVYYNQESNPETKMQFFDQLIRSPGFIKIKPLVAMQYRYFSDWRLISLRELVLLGNFSDDPDKVRESLAYPDLTDREIKGLIATLLELRLIEKDLRGKYHAKEVNLEIPDGLSLPFLYRFHMVMLGRAQWALMNVAGTDRNVSTVSLAVNLERMEEINAYVTSLRKEFIAKFAASSGPATICNFQIQFFPLSGKKKS